MIRWFRFYHEAVDDPKLRALPDRLFRLWMDLLCIASENDPRGQLPSVAVLSIRLKRRLDHVQGGVKQLIKAHLLERSMGVLSIHNWGKFQYKSDDVTARVQRYRNVARNDHETPPDTDTETDTERSVPSEPRTAPTFPVARKQFLTASKANAVARLVDLGDCLEFPRNGGIAASIVRDYGHGERVVKVMVSGLSAEGDPWEYVKGALRNERADKTRSSGGRSRQSVATKDDLERAKRYAAGGEL